MLPAQPFFLVKCECSFKRRGAAGSFMSLEEKQAAAERIRAELVKESEPELDDATKASR